VTSRRKRRTLPPRKCERCGETFIPRTFRQKLHGSSCYKGYSHAGRFSETDKVTQRKRKRENYTPAFERVFMAWDGEGEGSKFTLLQNSDGSSISARVSGLSTQQCLDFLLKAPRDRAHVWFAFGYDVNMILRDLPWRCIEELCVNGITYWQGYTLTYFPRKIFRVSRKDTGQVYTSYDVWGFFQSSFIRALEDWHIRIPAIIREGKAARADFTRWPLARIKAYNGAECELLVTLMDRLRDAINGAGWYVSSWHGAGALSQWFLKKIGAHAHIRALPEEMEEHAARAYFGGRIDAAGWGTIPSAYHYDIASAYPWAMTHLPSLQSADWKRTRRPSNPFSLCHISWKTPGHDWLWNPLPYRQRDGSIIYPKEGEGWYWLVEIDAAREAFEGRNLQIKMHEAYTLATHETMEPLNAPIAEAFAYRAKLKAAKNAAHVPVKLGLNSLYGKMAQRVSFGRQPRFYSLAWAGYVTAFTRAQIMRDTFGLAPYCIMTDSVTSEEPLPKRLVRPGHLGGWEGDKIRDLSVIESGFYEYEGGRWTRGFEPSAVGLSVADMVEIFEQGETSIPFEVNRFVGMKLARMGERYARAWRTFLTMPREVRSPRFDGTTKREGNLFEPLPKPGEWHFLRNRIAAEGVISYPYDRVETAAYVVRDEDRAALECAEEGEE
jgi:DNA polymerase family B